jgi:hypothetical protein
MPRTVAQHERSLHQPAFCERGWAAYVKKDGTNSTTTAAGAVAALPTGASLSVTMAASRS